MCGRSRWRPRSWSPRRHRSSDHADRLLDRRFFGHDARSRSRSTAMAPSAACFSGSMPDACAVDPDHLALGLFSILGSCCTASHTVSASPCGLIGALVATAASIPHPHHDRGIARIIPRDESTRRRGRFRRPCRRGLDRAARPGMPGRVRLKDVFGNWHSVPARASSDSSDLPVGASVLLVDREPEALSRFPHRRPHCTTTIIRQT